jgi:hypothetical protein
LQIFLAQILIVLWFWCFDRIHSCNNKTAGQCEMRLSNFGRYRTFGTLDSTSVFYQQPHPSQGQQQGVQQGEHTGGQQTWGHCTKTHGCGQQGTQTGAQGHGHGGQQGQTCTGTQQDVGAQGGQQGVQQELQQDIFQVEEVLRIWNKTVTVCRNFETELFIWIAPGDRFFLVFHGSLLTYLLNFQKKNVSIDLT